MPVIQGYLAACHRIGGEIERVPGYPLTPWGLAAPLVDLCYVPEIAADRDVAPVGIEITHLALFNAADADATMLMSWALPPPHTISPWQVGTASPRFDFPTAVSNAMYTTLYQGGTTDWVCKAKAVLGTADGFPLIAATRLTVVNGCISPAPAVDRPYLVVPDVPAAAPIVVSTHAPTEVRPDQPSRRRSVTIG